MAIATIYTDGACSGNPGPGGWGTVLTFDDGRVDELGGAAEQTTNNRMELQAAIAALEVLARGAQTAPVTLYTDSEYVLKGITQWVAGWKRRGWKTAQGKPVLNRDLWETLDRLNSSLVRWQHVRGHSGNAGNERCDAIARAFASGTVPTLARADTAVVNPSRPLPSDAMVTNEASPEESRLSSATRLAHLHDLIETLHAADEIADKGYLISSSELADLMDVNASAVTSRGDNWPWRNWIVSRVRREGNQILWQLERADS